MVSAAVPYCFALLASFGCGFFADCAVLVVVVIGGRHGLWAWWSGWLLCFLFCVLCDDDVCSKTTTTTDRREDSSGFIDDSCL